jgi:anti-sigma factor RsiW
MRCSRVRSKLVSLVDGRLTGEQEADLYQHLESCPVCDRQFRQLRKQVRLLAEPTRFSPPSDLWPRLQKGLAAEQPAAARRSSVLVYRPTVLAAAAVLLVALFAWIYWPQSSEQTPPIAATTVEGVGEAEELDQLFRAHKSLEWQNPLSAELGIVALVTESNSNGTPSY